MMAEHEERDEKSRKSTKKKKDSQAHWMSLTYHVKTSTKEETDGEKEVQG